MNATEVPLLPIYLVIDVAESAVSKPEMVNRIFPAVVDALRKHPAAAAHARIGLIDFASLSRRCLSLTDVLNPRFVPPQLTIGGRRSYIAAFRAMHSRIPSDLQQMRDAGHPMDHPVALFVTDGTEYSDAMDGTVVIPLVVLVQIMSSLPLILDSERGPSYSDLLRLVEQAAAEHANREENG